jgi:class 3 adenylate cyclase
MFLQLAERFIPVGFSTDEETRRSARLVINTMLLTSLFSFNYLIYSLAIGFIPGAWFMVFNAISFLVLPFVFRAGWLSRQAMSLLFLTIGTLGVMGAASFQGGYFAATALWVILIPLMAVLLSGRTAAIVFTVVAGIFLLGLWSFDHMGYRLPDHIAPEHFKVWHLNNVIGLLLITYLVANVFFQTKTRAFNSVKEKNDQLKVEKDRSESLLLNILPAEVAEELKATGQAEAKEFAQVTILFSDFKNFTTISSDMTPKDLVAELNACFYAFDAIMDKYDLEKIKTIGDAYMAASGLPGPKFSRPADMVRAALEMQAFMRAQMERNALTGKPAFQMRVGIHCGPVVAGIVGVKKFQYDVWGDTVNTAARMEQNSEVGLVNISESTYALVKDTPGLSFTHRGQIEAKGKGMLAMYFVHRTPVTA